MCGLLAFGLQQARVTYRGTIFFSEPVEVHAMMLNRTRMLLSITKLGGKLQLVVQPQGSLSVTKVPIRLTFPVHVSLCKTSTLLCNYYVMALCFSHDKVNQSCTGRSLPYHDLTLKCFFTHHGNSN